VAFLEETKGTFSQYSITIIYVSGYMSISLTRIATLGFHTLLSRPIVFELCAETLDACLAAREGGADRIELCAALEVGGLTPHHELVTEAVHRSGLPVHVILRPHADGFHYSVAGFDSICEELHLARRLGVTGVVFGILHADGGVDVERTRTLVDLAGPLETTFHRAFDATPDLAQALEDVISTGCDRILTSGGAPDVLAGADTLARLVTQAADRIQIAAGGGLRLENARTVARITQARHFHGSLQQPATNTLLRPTVSVEDIRRMKRILQGAICADRNPNLC
jgi:copper homeostasis protein